MTRTILTRSACVLLLAGAPAAGCVQYRQTAFNVTPAVTAECPDMSTGCSKTVVGMFWGAVRLSDPPPAQCGPTGLAEVTVRSGFFGTLVGVATLGIVTPHQVQWKCARPEPAAGGGIVPPPPPPLPPGS